MKKITFYQIINQTLFDLMKRNKKIVAFGLGIDDPKALFGTTKNLKKKFGDNRVFDFPTSENAMTGIGIGMSLNGMIPIMTHLRLDFFLLAMDQLVNNAAKWNIMFGGQNKIPITIRLIIGRGWGQGPTHSQNLQSWFSHVPGLKVITPSFPSNAKNLLIDSVNDPNPVIFIEHRWLHNLEENIKFNRREYLIGKSKKLSSGKELTIVSSSFSTIEILKLHKILKKNQIKFDHIDLMSVKPLDISNIFKSVNKTGRLLILDNSSHQFCSISSEIISQLILRKKNIFRSEPIILALPDIPSPTSFFLTKKYYNSSTKILSVIEKLISKKINYNRNQLETTLHDVPDKNFMGPF
tara:strand:+ start:570 stop:1625 length:1056 start_codon:yes stop_codon:yes gene_type:complete